MMDPQPGPMPSPTPLSDQPISAQPMSDEYGKFILELLAHHLSATPPPPQKPGIVRGMSAASAMISNPGMAKQIYQNVFGPESGAASRYASEQQQIPHLIQALGSMGARGMTQAGMMARRPQVKRYQTTYWDPSRNQNVLVNEYRDPVTMQLLPPPGSPPGTPPQLEDAGTPALHYSLGTGPTGESVLFPSGPVGNVPIGGGVQPGSISGQGTMPGQMPTPPKPFAPKSGPQTPTATAGPMGPGIAPAVTPSQPRGAGGVVHTGVFKPPPPQAVQEMQMLDQTTQHLTHMKEIMQRNASRGGISRTVGTEMAEGGILGRAAASYNDPDARDYQGDWSVVTGNMNSFQTGQNRLIVGEIPLIQANNPSFAEEPNSSIARLDTSLQAVDRARQRMLAQYPSLKAGQAGAAQRTVPRSRINALPPEDRAATEAGLRAKGVQIDEAN